MATDSQMVTQTKHYVLEVGLEDGQTITADVGEQHQATSEIRSLHDGLSTGGFVSIGDRALVRSEEVKYVLLREAKEESNEGFLASMKSRIQGGDGMSYSSQQMPETPTNVRTQDGGPAFPEQWVGYGRRPWAETKPFFMTSEFLTLLATIIAVSIAMLVSDLLDATRGWTLITVLSTGYMLSRGIAKAGTRDPNPQQRST
jgi:hypothetical protein